MRNMVEVQELLQELNWAVAEPEVYEPSLADIQPIKVRQPTASDLARAMEIGRQHGWKFRICGKGRMIAQPIVLKNGWKGTPLEQDTGYIPPEAYERLEAVTAEVDIQGVIVFHEPEIPSFSVWALIGAWLKVAMYAALAVSAVILTIVMAVVATLVVAVVAVPVIAVGAILFGGLMAANGGIDPVLCVVLNDEDQTIVELFRWDA